MASDEDGHDWHYAGTNVAYGDPAPDGCSPRVVCSTCPDWFEDSALVFARNQHWWASDE